MRLKLFGLTLDRSVFDAPVLGHLEATPGPVHAHADDELRACLDRCAKRFELAAFDAEGRGAVLTAEMFRRYVTDCESALTASSTAASVTQWNEN